MWRLGQSLRACAQRIGTCAQPRLADLLEKHAVSLPISTQSLFGEGLKSVITKVTSTARNYVAMAEGFIQAGLYKPRPKGPNKGQYSWKRKREGSPLTFRFEEPPVQEFRLVQQVFLQIEEASPRSCPKDGLPALKGVKAPSWPDESA